MSRIGRAPIAVPAGVEVSIADNNVVTVKGPKGTLVEQFHPNMTITLADGVITVTRPNDLKENRARGHHHRGSQPEPDHHLRL